jgi:uncharacterized protein (UPF0332 family)
MHDKQIELAEYRINDALERLNTSKSLLSLGKYKDAFNIRQDSDYNDFFVVSKEDAEMQVVYAEEFYNTITKYIKQRTKEEKNDS